MSDFEREFSYPTYHHLYYYFSQTTGFFFFFFSLFHYKELRFL